MLTSLLILGVLGHIAVECWTEEINNDSFYRTFVLTLESFHLYQMTFYTISPEKEGFWGNAWEPFKFSFVTFREQQEHLLTSSLPNVLLHCTPQSWFELYNTLTLLPRRSPTTTSNHAISCFLAFEHVPLFSFLPPSSRNNFYSVFRSMFGCYFLQETFPSLLPPHFRFPLFTFKLRVFF